MARYKVTSKFEVYDENEVGFFEVAELTDTKTNTRYQFGARRFRLRRPIKGFRTKTFRGETAEYEVESYGRDVLRAAQA